MAAHEIWKSATKKDKNPKKVSFHAQNRQKSNPISSITETGKREVSKQNTEQEHLLFVKIKKILVQQPAGLLYNKSRIVGRVYIIYVDKNSHFHDSGVHMSF